MIIKVKTKHLYDSNLQRQLFVEVLIAVQASVTFFLCCFSASQQKSTVAKTTLQASARSGKAEGASAKRQDRKKIPAARDQLPKKNGGQFNRPTKEKTYKTLWKTNQMNLFDDNHR